MSSVVGWVEVGSGGVVGIAVGVSGGAVVSALGVGVVSPVQPACWSTSMSDCNAVFSARC